MDPLAQAAEILIVEDDIVIRESLYALLHREGYTVATVPHGQAALAYLHQVHQHPSLILLDLLMPIMDGYDFRRLQQQDARLAQIPVVVLSAQSLSERDAASMHVAFYLRKPLDVHQLLTIVDSYCRPEDFVAQEGSARASSATAGEGRECKVACRAGHGNELEAPSL